MLPGLPTREPTDAEFLYASWKAGLLAWKLRPYQLEAYETIWRLIESLRGRQAKRTDYRMATFVASRKIGKSFIEALIGIEFAQRFPKSRISLIAPTGVACRDVFEPEFEAVLTDCPLDLKPAKKGLDGNWHFPNGSIIYIRGADMKPDRLRGPSRDLILGDEAAYINRLRRTVESILYPMTINTRGIILLCSTLNQSPNADFNAYHTKCKALGQSATVDVYHAGFTEEQIEAERAAASPATWAIEYECREERDPDQTVIPEWTPPVAAALTGSLPAEATTRREWLYYRRFLSGDWGTSDNTVLLTAIYDFLAGKLYFLSEKVSSGAEVTANAVAAAIRTMERDADERANRAPDTEWTRTGDHDIPLLNSLQVDHDLTISLVRKFGLEGMVNTFRDWVKNDRIVIDPSCVNLLACLEHAAWVTAANTRRDAPRVRVLARSDLIDKNRVTLGHFDALMAAVYAVITADLYRAENPIPQLFVTAEQVAANGPYTPETYFPAADGAFLARKPAAVPGWLAARGGQRARRR